MPRLLIHKSGKIIAESQDGKTKRLRWIGVFCNRCLDGSPESRADYDLFQLLRGANEKRQQKLLQIVKKLERLTPEQALQLKISKKITSKDACDLLSKA